jgi:hypothetical protein
MRCYASKRRHTPRHLLHHHYALYPLLPCRHFASAIAAAAITPPLPPLPPRLRFHFPDDPPRHYFRCSDAMPLIYAAEFSPCQPDMMIAERQR